MASQIGNDFNSFQVQNSYVESVRAGTDDIHDIARAAKMLPMYKELSSKYSLHIDLGK